MSASPDMSATKQHLLTIMLEDYFHVNAFSGLIQRGQWYRFETRFENNTLRALDLLDRFDIKATFFVLGWVADRHPEIVCSIDCDCTYDPHELQNMIPRLTEGVDVVTASPYHPEGKVRNVPGWRLALSKAASFLYRRTLRQQLFTYTSCFRVYRRDAVVDLRLKETGFLGVAEIIGRLDMRGSTVVEHPATLEVRLFGQSKMKVFRTIIGHLKLLTYLRLARARLKPLARDESVHFHVEPAGPTELSPQSVSTIPSEWKA